MASKSKNRCIEISKDEFLQLAQKNKWTEVDFETLAKEKRASVHNGEFVYVNIVGVHYPLERVGHRELAPYPVWQWNLANDEKREDSVGMLLVDKSLFLAQSAHRLAIDKKIAVVGFRRSFGKECSKYPLALILDERCTEGSIYVISNVPPKENVGREQKRMPKQTKSSTASASATTSNKDSKYLYTHLSDLSSLPMDSRVNVYGIVKAFETVNNTLRLSLWEPLLGDATISCSLSTWASNVPLPDVRQVGDIIRLHRAAVQQDVNSVKLFGRMGTYGLNAIIWDGQFGNDLTPRTASSVKYTLEESDYETVRYLRQQLLPVQFNLASAEPPIGQNESADTLLDLVSTEPPIAQIESMDTLPGGPTVDQSRVISSFKAYSKMNPGIYEMRFTIDTHDQNLVYRPEALFQWKCPLCHLRLSFGEHYSMPLARWMKCRRCSAEKGEDVPFQLISRFVLTASFVNAQEQEYETLSMKLLVEGAVADAILGKSAKYLWKDLRTTDNAAAEINMRLNNLIDRKQWAVVDMKIGEKFPGVYERQYTVMEWKET